MQLYSLALLQLVEALIPDTEQVRELCSRQGELP